VSVLDAAGERSHLLLGGIRLFNGATALLVPELVVRRLGADPDASPSAVYPLRMFGVRTVVLGAELLLGAPETRRRSLELGVLVHASDTASVALGGLRGQLPPRTAALLTGVSTLNTALAVLGTRAARRSRPRWRLRS